MIVIALVIIWLALILCLVLSPFFIGLMVLRVPYNYLAKRSDRFKRIYITDLAALTFVMALFIAPYRRYLNAPYFSCVATLLPLILWYVSFTVLRDARIENALQRLIFCAVVSPIVWVCAFSFPFLSVAWFGEVFTKPHQDVIGFAIALCACILGLIVLRKYVLWMFSKYGVCTLSSESQPVMADLV